MGQQVPLEGRLPVGGRHTVATYCASAVRADRRQVLWQRHWHLYGWWGDWRRHSYRTSCRDRHWRPRDDCR